MQQPMQTMIHPVLRLAAIDLDDTLLGTDKWISPENAEAVQRLQQTGIRCVLASGRRHENMLRFHQRLALEGFIVSCNGALVKDADTREVLREQLVPAPLAAEIVEIGDALGLTQNYYHTDGGLYVREETRWTSLYETRTESQVNVHGELEDFHGENALKIIWIDAPERIQTLFLEMKARFGETLYITTTDPEYLEFMAQGVSKAVGVATVAEILGIEREAVVAFGDGNNDVPLLEWAGISYAMDHARPAAQAAADRITPSGDPNTSFARAVAHLLDG
ncbi:MAG: Cof-type HAD-IIB family hydrolase [Armatimonadaceae bacterium]